MRIFSKLFAALVVLTLISCCFMGTTFARYLTTNSNTARVNVATWNVDITAASDAEEGTTTLSFKQLSPNMNESGATGANLKKSTAKKLVATITVTAEVKAKLTLDFGKIIIKDSDGAEVFKDGAVTPADKYGIASGTTISYNDVAGVFSIKFYANEENNAAEATALGTEGDDWTLDVTTGTTWTKPIDANTTTTIYLFADVTWTTWYKGNDPAGINSNLKGSANADKFDNWIGGNVETLEWNLKYTAAQASELPDA